MEASPARSSIGGRYSNSRELCSLSWCICLLPFLAGCPQFQADEFEKAQGESGSGAGGSAGSANTGDPVNVSITSAASGGSGGSGGGGGSGGSGAADTVTTAASAGGSDAGVTGSQSATDSASSTDGGGSGGTDSTSQCNNGTLDPDEDCDGAKLGGASCESESLGTGQLSCKDDCSFETSDCIKCGDGKVQADEQCEGSDLVGENCETQGFVAGELVCNDECQLNKEGCTYCFTASDSTGVVFSGDTSEHESRVNVHNSSCTDGGEGPDVSFTWTAPTTDCYLITVSSSNDTILSVYDDCSLATELECDDAYGYGQGSEIYFQQATADTEYTVVVDSFSNTDAGPVTVEITTCGGDWGGNNTSGRP